MYFEPPDFCSRQGTAQLRSHSYESEYVTPYCGKRWLSKFLEIYYTVYLIQCNKNSHCFDRAVTRVIPDFSKYFDFQPEGLKGTDAGHRPVDVVEQREQAVSLLMTSLW